MAEKSSFVKLGTEAGNCKLKLSEARFQTGCYELVTVRVNLNHQAWGKSSG